MLQKRKWPNAEAVSCTEIRAHNRSHWGKKRERGGESETASIRDHDENGKRDILK